MKKTMFITSVIMVVVMAIALTTSSLAWFTAQGSATVKTNPVTVAATANAGVGLLISVDNASFTSGPLTIADESGTTEYKPIVPNVGGTTETALDNITADGVLAAIVGGSFIGRTTTTSVIEDNNNHVTVPVWSTDDAYTKTFWTDDIYVANISSAAQAVTATVKYDTTQIGAGAKLVVAVAAKNATGWDIIHMSQANPNATPVAGDGNYAVGTANPTINVGGDTAKFGAGELVSRAYTDFNTNTATLTDATSFVKAKTTTNLSARTENIAYGTTTIQFKVIAWYDGVQLNNGNSGTSSAPFIVEFTATTANS